MEEQIALLSTKEEVNSKLSQKISLQQMMGFMESVNQSLSRKSTVGYVRQSIPARGWDIEPKAVTDLKHALREVSNSLELFRQSCEAKLKEFQTNLKFQNDYVCSYIQRFPKEGRVSDYCHCAPSSTGSNCTSHQFRYPPQQANKGFLIHDSAEISKLKAKIASLQLDVENVVKIHPMITQIKTKISTFKKSLDPSSELAQDVKVLTTRVQTTSRDLERVQSQMNIIFRNICYQNVVARWGCSQVSGKDVLIPWEFQLINTLSDNYLWKKNCKQVSILSGGIYQITFVGFSKTQVVYKVFLNQNLVGQVNWCHSEYKASVESIVTDIVGESRIFVTVQGESQQGILWIKKL